MSVVPRRPKGPPLNALRAFEAAARRESFVAAAEELGVTPGAVSQHVKALEHWAGIQLFRRDAKGVRLTSAGRGLMPKFCAAFDALGAATLSLRNLKPDADVHIAALPSVAQLWLPNRLTRIRQQFGHLRFSVTAMETPPRLGRELFDFSLFIGTPPDEAQAVAIEKDAIMPVCAPFLAGRQPGEALLASAPLLHDLTWADDWQIWANRTSMDIGDPESGPGYSLYSLAVEEAKAGAGILMGHTCLIAADLAEGRLVPVFPGPAVETGRVLWLGLPHPVARRVEVNAIASLLQA